MLTDTHTARQTICSACIKHHEVCRGNMRGLCLTCRARNQIFDWLRQSRSPGYSRSYSCIRTAEVLKEGMATFGTCRYLGQSPPGLIRTLQTTQRRLAHSRMRLVKTLTSASTRQLTNVETASDALEEPSAAPHIPVLLHEVLHAFSDVDLRVGRLSRTSPIPCLPYPYCNNAA